MWTCMICGRMNKASLCRCGQLRAENYTTFRTLCPVSEKDEVKALQKRYAIQEEKRREEQKSREMEALQKQVEELKKQTEVLKKENDEMKLVAGKKAIDDTDQTKKEPGKAAQQNKEAAGEVKKPDTQTEVKKEEKEKDSFFLNAIAVIAVGFYLLWKAVDYGGVLVMIGGGIAIGIMQMGALGTIVGGAVSVFLVWLLYKISPYVFKVFRALAGIFGACALIMYFFS